MYYLHQRHGSCTRAFTDARPAHLELHNGPEQSKRKTFPFDIATSLANQPKDYSVVVSLSLSNTLIFLLSVQRIRLTLRFILIGSHHHHHVIPTIRVPSVALLLAVCVQYPVWRFTSSGRKQTLERCFHVLLLKQSQWYTIDCSSCTYTIISAPCSGMDGLLHWDQCFSVMEGLVDWVSGRFDRLSSLIFCFCCPVFSGRFSSTL